jgi:hypothetical protein
MINAEHDFTHNFCNAIGYENDFMMKDIIIDEVGRLIVENKADVVNLLRKNGINATVNDSPKIISGLLVNEISKENTPVIKGISDMIAKNRFDESKYKSILGFQEKAKEAVKAATSTGQTSTAQKTDGTFWKKLGEAFKDPQVQQSASTLIAGGLAKAYSKTTPKTTTENQANLDERLKINQTRQKEKINYKKIAIISGIVAVVGLLAFQIYKMKKAQSV